MRSKADKLRVVTLGHHVGVALLLLPTFIRAQPRPRHYSIHHGPIQFPNPRPPLVRFTRPAKVTRIAVQFFGHGVDVGHGDLIYTQLPQKVGQIAHMRGGAPTRGLIAPASRPVC